MARTNFTINSIDGAIVDRSHTGWRINAASNDIRTCEILVDAPGAGSNIYLESISAIFSDDIVVTIGTGESNSRVETPVLGPFSTSFDFDFSDNPVKLAANKALTADSSLKGLVCIVAKGYTI